MKSSIISQVRELLDRNLDWLEITHRLNLNPSDVQLAIEIIKQLII